MRRLYPEATDEELDGVYAELSADAKGWVAIGMVTSLDGAATVDGVSGGLGQEGDRAAFRGLRAASDVILVGAGTVRSESYGPPKLREADRQRRAARGQAQRPAIAVVSGSLDLTGVERLWHEEPDWRPIVVTHGDADAARADDLRELGADVLVAGEDGVDLALAIDLLRDRGHARVLCEGGPHLNGQLLEAGLVDEVFVTLAPLLVGGRAGRIVASEDPVLTSLELVEVRQHASEVLLRYRVAR